MVKNQSQMSYKSNRFLGSYVWGKIHVFNVFYNVNEFYVF